MMRRGGRRGPGIVGTMARTAVIAGTATAVSNKVSGSMAAKAHAQQQAHETQQAAHQAAFQSQAQVQELQAQMTALQAQQVQAAAAPAGDADVLTRLQQLGQMKEQGLLTDAEFAAAKAKLLGM